MNKNPFQSLFKYKNPVNRLAYTKNTVTGRNETLVNTSTLKEAVSGVATKITSKAERSAVEAVSVYAEGVLPKGVYTPLMDAYVGLTCKVAGPDVLEGAAKMAYAVDPEKYATRNPDREDVVKVTYSNFIEGNPIYDAVESAGSTVKLPLFLSLKAVTTRLDNVVSSWKTELPNLTNGDGTFS